MLPARDGIAHAYFIEESLGCFRPFFPLRRLIYFFQPGHPCNAEERSGKGIAGLPAEDGSELFEF